MKNLRLLTMSGLLVIAGSAYSQVPAGAPAGTTGICKDGTYSTATSKAGACSGHKGVQTWYTTPAPAAAKTMPAPTPAPTAPAKPAPTPAPAATAPAMPAPSPAAKTAVTAAAGGSPSLVWVNTESNVYHCYGTSYYGKTKAGAYMSEADAKAKGAHADHGKACTK